YTALHWADKQKPLREVAGEFGVFPETTDSPPLVPETIDQETPLPAAEVSLVDEVTLVERVTVTEHFLVVEHVPARRVERRAKPREPEAQREMEAA
ncbi:MAG: hypothetical protein QOJ84_5111, partial [Bradyrhizobium sp.]|nr:hypothetical protein [Bradyrhizobium sp.]